MAGRAVRNSPPVTEGHTDDFKICETKDCPPFPKLAIERYWKNILKKGWQHQLNIKHDYDFTAFATHYSWVPEVVVWWRRRSTWFGARRQHDHLFDQSFAFGAHFPHHALVATNQSFAGTFKVGEHDGYVLKGWWFSVVQCISATKTVAMLELRSQCCSDVGFRLETLIKWNTLKCLHL